MIPDDRSVAFETLGCRLNQAETESIATDFAAAGWKIVPSDSPADVYVINTCTVTNQSDRKSRNTINQATRRAGIVVATGCYVDSARDSLEARDDVTYVVDNAHKSRIFQLVDAHFRGEMIHPDRLPPGRFTFTPGGRHTRTRTAVKVQDGCDNFCTFCIIPFVRGRAVSRSVESVIENVRSVIEDGSREIVITGVNMGRYAHNGEDFPALLERILTVSGDFRVRVSSLEPEPLDDRFVELFDNPKLCPHLHLCLQSGSDRMLLAMRRTYSVGQYLDFVERIRKRHPRFNLTTDVIVGFPGETDKEFEETCRVVRDVGFGHVHTFKYSVRDGTRAARMEDQVAESVKSERSEAIRKISVSSKRIYRADLLGTRQRVLIERTADGRAHGYGESYVPIVVPRDTTTLNVFCDVEVMSLDAGDDPTLLGRPL